MKKLTNANMLRNVKVSRDFRGLKKEYSVISVPKKKLLSKGEVHNEIEQI